MTELGVSEPVTLASLDAKVQHLGSRMNRMALQVDAVGNTVNDARAEVLDEIRQVRKLVTGDHAPRITTLEKHSRSLSGRVVVGAQWTAYVTAALTVLAQVAAFVRPDLVGPIQSIMQLLHGAQ